MVIDEAQDMDDHEFELVRAIAEHNEDLRIIAVGDDDQNIYEFRGSSSEYMKQILSYTGSKLYELIENYRSKPNLVDLTNCYAMSIPNRMKSMPIVPRQKHNGSIQFVYHPSDAMIDGVLEKLIQDRIKGSICILTVTNDEALQMTGRLNDAGLKAKLIQNRDEIRLENLDEVRFFISQLNISEGVHTIDYSEWGKAKQSLLRNYETSEQLPLIKRMLTDFEAIAGKYLYVSDFMIFIKESRMEDFLEADVETILVSTMHKAKGQEFDSVIIMLDRFSDYKDEAKRAFYVAMTRAKDHLQIHYRDNNILKAFSPDYMPSDSIQFIEMRSVQKNKRILILQLSYKDIFLSYYYQDGVQDKISDLRSGDELILKEHGCYTESNIQVLRFSKSFKEKLNAFMEKGFDLAEAKVSAVVYWKHENQENEVRILFPVVKLVGE